MSGDTLSGAPQSAVRQLGGEEEEDDAAETSTNASVSPAMILAGSGLVLFMIHHAVLAAATPFLSSVPVLFCKMPCCPRKKHPAAIDALEPKDHANAKVPA